MTLWNEEIHIVVGYVVFWIFVRYVLDINKDGYVRGFVHAFLCVALNSYYLNNYNATVTNFSLVFMIMDCFFIVMDSCSNSTLYLMHHVGVILCILAFQLSESEMIRNSITFVSIAGEVTNLLQSPWEISERRNFYLLNAYVPFYSLVRLIILPLYLLRMLTINELGLQVNELAIVFVGSVFVFISFQWIRNIVHQHKHELIWSSSYRKRQNNNYNDNNNYNNSKAM